MKDDNNREKRNEWHNRIVPFDPSQPMMKVRYKNCERVSFPQCENPNIIEPVFNVVGNIDGMASKESPVSNMKMYFHQKKDGGPPELNFDIDLKKECGEDEKFCFSNVPDEKQERERRANEKLCLLEQELERVRNKLNFLKKLREEWNVQKAGLCNRRLKDKPKCFDYDKI